MIDSFYTPKYIVELLINFTDIAISKNAYVADFAVGNGELLEIAAKKWPGCNFVGTDIDENCIRRLKRIKPIWRLGISNFLNVNSRHKCKPLINLEGKCRLILLNPPFSCRGGTKLIATLDDEIYYCSTSMAFILNALKYLEDGGQLVAIIPGGSLFSLKDKNAWDTIKKNFRVKVKEIQGNGHFIGCNPNFNIVKISKIKPGRKIKSHVDNIQGKEIQKSKIKVSRGSIQMHEIADLLTNNSRAIYLIHSTDIKNGEIQYQRRIKYNGNSISCRPAILFPRVGTPSIDKIAILKDRAKVALSDCVMAVTTENIVSANHLIDSIKKNRKDFIQLYSGTGAKYTTLDRVYNFINAIS